MNERIKELAMMAKEMATTTDVSGKLVLCISSDTFEEKFAELIVLECVRYFNEDYKRDFDTRWREDLSKGIKEHFGVK